MRPSLFRKKRALSPLVATILLVAFALVIGTVTMNWGRSYVEKIKEEPEVKGVFESAVIISIKDVDRFYRLLKGILMELATQP